MLRNLLIMTTAAAALSVAAAADADAGMGAAARLRANVGVNAHSHMAIARTSAGIHARAQVRGPQFTPHGWSQGRKTGWHCRVGTRGCIPPGLR